MMEGLGKSPAGFLYVAWHPKSPGYTKIGWSLWDPVNPCEKYPGGKKRIHDVQKYLEAFGFGPLQVRGFPFHRHARLIEGKIKKKLVDQRRGSVGRNREIFDIDPQNLISLIETELYA
ncbi:GIY-YIG nuclease family protein [Sphingomonas mesophila]|uniref:GIY-YIG nuclease family protein n=1 Tax=Sphingomonas mesophila TaxID=2303576 RepID=UPI0013C2FB92|nr:GIY-YIG nuclease family protein [Sphingomonas mesophila]